MTRSLLGCHWIRTHPDGRDLSHVERMQYPSVKLFEWHWSDRNACADLLEVLPKDAYILARDHPLSEQPIWDDPAGIGIRQANEWAMKVASGNYHLPVERTFFLGRNEPDATSGDRNAIDLYTASLLNRLTVHGLRGGAFNFSTGHPRTVDGTGNTRADYTVFERSHQAIVAGHHIGVLHIYGTASTPCAPGHFDRLKACPWQDVEWVVGEMGADEHVVGGGNHDGFLISMKDNPARYCQWLDQLIMGIADPRIHSYQVFSHDFSHPWSSFDIRPIRDALESYDWQHVKQQPPKPDTPPPSKPVDIHLPQIGSGPQPAAAIAYVSAPAGLRLRAQPSTQSDTLANAPFRAQVRLIGVSGVEGWVRVRYDGMEGYMSAEYISVGEPPAPLPTPAPEPQPMPAGILDPLVAQAILQIESGGRTHGENNKPIIRFEAHVFEDKADYTGHFRYNEVRPWTDQQWRKSENEPWRNVHTGQQADEYAAFEFAKSINPNAAYQAISVGAGQILGINHARVGYPSAEAMFRSFQSAPMQIVGFLNYFLSDPALVDAVRRKDWREIARRFNGSGAVDTYAPLLEKAYKELTQ